MQLKNKSHDITYLYVYSLGCWIKTGRKNSNAKKTYNSMNSNARNYVIGIQSMAAIVYFHFILTL